MSLILDALRRGRAPEITQPNSSTAQTDAVLQTLGYGHLEPSSSPKRIRRLVGYACLALLAVVAICGAVIWFARQHYATDEGVHIVHKASSAAAESAAVETPQMQIPGTGPSLSAGSAGSAGMSAGSGASATLPIVQDSRQPDVPVALPAPAAGAASLRTPAPDADHFQLALYYQRSGDFENALLQYRAVLQRDELNAEAHNNLGLLYRGKGLYDEAAKEFVRAIAINQRYVKAHNNLGVTYLSQQKADAAAAEFQTALRETWSRSSTSPSHKKTPPPEISGGDRWPVRWKSIRTVPRRTITLRSWPTGQATRRWRLRITAPSCNMGTTIRISRRRFARASTS
jgi:hypothetical protein